MKTLIKTTATSIVLAAIFAGPASAACGTFYGGHYEEPKITYFDCDDTDDVAEELKARLDISESDAGEIAKSASRSVKNAPNS